MHISIHQKLKKYWNRTSTIIHVILFKKFNLSKWMGRSCSQIWPTFFLICQTSHVPSGFSVYSNSQLDSIVLTILLNQRDNSSTLLLLFRKPKRYFIRKVMTNCSALSLICITLKPTYLLPFVIWMNFSIVFKTTPVELMISPWNCERKLCLATWCGISIWL